MAKKQMLFKTKGMNRDLSVSAFNPEFAFENHNLRLSTNENNTLMSWVNEKGTAELMIYDTDPETPSKIIIEGVAIGTAVLNHKLVLFTTNCGGSYNDKIYLLWYSADLRKIQMQGKVLYEGNLSFDVNYPLETLVSYESEIVQKVYWTDGKNQPRVINIAKDTKEDISKYDDTSFDFIPTLKLKETVKVKKELGATGVFAPGVIQYAFTYYRKYGQESCIFYTTPLYYISYKDRGGAPDDKIENAFKITVENLDKNFDYLRIYSIQRTSVNGTPICKRIQDIPIDDSYDTAQTDERYYLYSSNSAPSPNRVPDITGVERTILGIEHTPCIGFNNNAGLEVVVGDETATFGSASTSTSIIWVTVNKINYNGVSAYYVVESPNDTDDDSRELMQVSSQVKKLTYVDTGTSGDTIDPTELLYKGGEEITALTMEQKDGTLFLGNLNIKRKQIEDLKNDIKTGTTFSQFTRIFYPEKVGDMPNHDSEHGIYYNSYGYYSQLTSYKDTQKTESVPCAGFKCGDYYRCGVQFQHKTGIWTEPIFLGDEKIGNRFNEHISDYNIESPIIIGTLNASDTIKALVNDGYKKVRAVVVYPEVQDRVVLCQGVANPTLYTDNHRNGPVSVEHPDGDNTGNNDLYAQASWFFRPGKTGGWLYNTGAAWPMAPTSVDTELAYTSNAIGTDSGGGYDPQSNIRRVEIQGDYNSENKFKITREFLTLNSPDVEFDDYLTTIDFENTAYQQVGESFFYFTMADIDIQVESPAASNNASGFIHKAFTTNNAYGIISGTFFEDYVIDDDRSDGSLFIQPDEKSPVEWMVYLWNKTGSLNNDIIRPSDKGTPTAILKKKIISNLRYTTTNFITPSDSDSYTTIEPQLYNSDEATILKFGSKIYRGNIDTVLTPDNADGMYCTFANTDDKPNPGYPGISTPFISQNWWKTFSRNPDNNDDASLWIKNGTGDTSYWKNEWATLGDKYISIVIKKEPVRMKYKSAPHLAFNDASESGISWNDNYLPVLEIINTNNNGQTKPDTLFGGETADALRENVWIPCGEPVDLADANGTALPSVAFKYEYGDTYFQRYDCLKTYAFTHEDINQVVEIGSFMLETRVNIDGRYDRNRGQFSNLYMSPQNFNLINHVYSQINNFFSYKIMDEDSYKNTVFPNQITWSKTKQAGADVDLWTNITLASILELDGDKGSLNKLARFNDQLLAFQDTGISQVLYNENVQISSTQGVPIELANSGKVQGKRYISDTIGCFNKWSVVSTPMGLYFMDSNDKSIYQFNGQLSNLSIKGGMNTWCKKEIPTIAESLKWTPGYTEIVHVGNIDVAKDIGFNNFVAYYDKQNQDVLFINNDTALAFSEKLGTFTSFYDYNRSDYLCSLDDTGVWIKNKHSSNNARDLAETIATKLWKHQGGNYCEFFDKLMPYNMTLVGNPEPLIDKIFTNLEFRASVDGDGSTTTEDEETVFNKFYLPFDKLEAWDEYQHGITTLSIMNGHNAMLHGGTTSSLKRKFRIWRCDIPRDNAELSTDAALGISRYSRRPNDRMRNPWLYLKLTKIPLPETPQYRTEIHDIVMTYFD